VHDAAGRPRARRHQAHAAPPARRTQESFAAIVDDARAGLAERYLATDRYTISDVSDRLGFAASIAFSRWFRRRFGISPTAWREATIGSAIPT
jgi:AraC-like DNA-binding protein